MIGSLLGNNRVVFVLRYFAGQYNEEAALRGRKRQELDEIG
jgi:hypothetical protein